MNKNQLKDDKNHRLIIKYSTIYNKNNNANPSDKGLEQAINDGKQSKAASQQQAKEAANSQGSNANNKLPLQSRTKESTSLNKSDQKSTRNC